MKVGFIGLGTMGAFMAANIQKAGYQLVVHDIRREAGANRRSRRPQKALRSIRPVFSHSLISSDVIKNPERVKKTETPKKPPGNQPRPE